MALADTMVVMNHGVIEQMGSPHEIYNRPVSEFVARFMGGHNVLSTAQGKISVRTDHMQLHKDEPTLDDGLGNKRAVITDIEYQGTYVLVGLQEPGRVQNAASTAEMSVMVPEASFDAQPFALGQQVQLRWQPEAAHALVH